MFTHIIKLNAAERNYSAVELEAQCVIFTISIHKISTSKTFCGRQWQQTIKSHTFAKNTKIAFWGLILQDYKIIFYQYNMME